MTFTIENCIQKAMTDLQKGRMIIIQDDASRENEGDLVMAAQFTQAKDINFMIQHARGLVCLPLSAAIFKKLQIPMMTTNNQSHEYTPFGVSIDSASGITTGISPADRAHTCRLAASLETCAQHIVMPGHVFPLKAQTKGVLKRPGHTEASIDMMRMTGLSQAAVICEIINSDGSMARTADLQLFAQQHQLALITIQDIIEYRRNHEC